jgi:hypothetical protein
MSCASTYYYGFDFNKYSSVQEVPIDSVRIYQNDLPADCSFSNELFYPDMQTAIFNEKPGIFSDKIGGSPIAKKGLQSFVSSNGDKGSIFYIYYTGQVNGGTKSFLSGLLWGSGSPSSHHPEEFFVSHNTIIIWAFKQESPLKKIAQQKLYDFLVRTTDK